MIPTKAGDVVIQRPNGDGALYAVGAVLNDGEQAGDNPQVVASLREAQAVARGLRAAGRNIYLRTGDDWVEAN